MALQWIGSSQENLRWNFWHNKVHQGTCGNESNQQKVQQVCTWVQIRARFASERLWVVYQNQRPDRSLLSSSKGLGHQAEGGWCWKTEFTFSEAVTQLRRAWYERGGLRFEAFEIAADRKEVRCLGNWAQNGVAKFDLGITWQQGTWNEPDERQLLAGDDKVDQKVRGAGELYKEDAGKLAWEQRSGPRAHR
jgi:hypothetical protein